MKLLVLIASLGLASAAPSSSNPVHARQEKNVPAKKLIIGAPGQIISAEFDGAQFSIKERAEEKDSGPSWLAFKEPNLLYAVNENSNMLRLFTYDAETNALEKVAEEESAAGVVHLAFNKDKTRMVGSAYGNGSIDFWDISAEDGSMKLIDNIVSDFNLDTSDPEAKAHPHQAVIDPTGRFFVATDLGTNTILVLDTKDDEFAVAGTVTVEGGCGPRHGVFHGPAGSDAKAKFYTVICESTNELLTWKLTYTGKTIEFADEPTAVSTFGDKPPPAPKEGGELPAAAAVVLSSNGKDLYASNRRTGEATDSVAHFRVSGCGSLTFKQLMSSRGVFPRMISLGGEDESILYVGNQQGADGLLAFSRDAASGKLLETPMAAAALSEFSDDVEKGPQFVLQVDASS